MLFRSAAIDNFEGVGKAGNFNVDWPALMKFKQKRIANLVILELIRSFQPKQILALVMTL